MNPRYLLCLALALAPGCRSPSAARRSVPDPTATKVRLYGEALAARDGGDLATAKARLQSLLELAPSDAGVKRLLANVEQALAAPRPAAPPAPAVPPPDTRPAAAPPALAAVSSVPDPRAQTPVSIPTAAPAATPTAFSKPPPAPASTLMPEVTDETVQKPAPDPRTRALVRVETTGAALATATEEARTEKLMTYIQAQRALAEEYAREGNFTVAIGTLDAALASIRISTDELETERARYVQGEVKAREGIRMRRRR